MHATSLKGGEGWGGATELSLPAASTPTVAERSGAELGPHNLAVAVVVNPSHRHTLSPGPYIYVVPPKGIFPPLPSSPDPHPAWPGQAAHLIGNWQVQLS